MQSCSDLGMSWPAVVALAVTFAFLLGMFAIAIWSEM